MKCVFNVCLLIILIALGSCQSDKIARPRPHMFPRIDFPKGESMPMMQQDCPFQASIPSYSEVLQTEAATEDETEHPCWFDLTFPALGATVHCSYYHIDSDRNLSSLIEDAYTMASKHNVKASFREELEIKNQHNAEGIIFSIEGDVASPYQFYITDSKEHFLRGSLYFNDKVDQDSVAPIITFLKEEVDDFLNSIDFNN